MSADAATGPAGPRHGAPALVDLDVCIGPLPSGDHAALDVPGLLEVMDRWGISHAVVHHSWARYADVAGGNQAVLDAVAGQPRLAAAVTVTPLATGEMGKPGAVRALLSDERVRLAVAFPRAHGWSLDGLEAASLLDRLAEAGRALLVPADETDLAAVAAACRTHPRLQVVLARAGYRSLRRLVEVLARCDNLRCDLSYFAAHDAVETLVERFGSRVFVYGSGMPYCDPAGSSARLRWSALDAPAHAAVARGNAEALAGPFAAPEEPTHGA